MRGTLKERLESKIWKRKVGQCWPWLAHRDTEGYARIWVDKETGSVLAHTMLYLITFGAIPEGKKVMTCPILKDCMNPAHVGLGDTSDVADRVLLRKKQKRVKPRRTPKVTDEQVRQIFLSTEPLSILAERFNISKPHIVNIKAGRRYAHLTQFEREQHADTIQE